MPAFLVSMAQAQEGSLGVEKDKGIFQTNREVNKMCKERKRMFCHTDLYSVRFLGMGQWDHDQGEFTVWCSYNQHTVVSNHVHVFDYSARVRGKQGHPGNHGWLRERGLHHLVSIEKDKYIKLNLCPCMQHINSVYLLHKLYLVFLSRPCISQYNQPTSPVLHMVQEVQLAWLNQERL